MKNKLLAIPLSVMMVVVFIPVFSFADTDDVNENETSLCQEIEDIISEEQPAPESDVDGEASEDVAETDVQENVVEETEEVQESESTEENAEVTEEAYLSANSLSGTLQDAVNMVVAVCDCFFDSYINSMDRDTFVGHWTLKYEGDDFSVDITDGQFEKYGFSKSSKKRIKNLLTGMLKKYYDEGANKGTYLVALFGYDKNFNMGGVYGVQDVGLERSAGYHYDNTVHEIGNEYYDDEYYDYDSDHAKIMEQIDDMELELAFDDLGWSIEAFIYGMFYNLLHVQSNGNVSPQTGDSIYVMLAAIAMLIALLGTATTLSMGRRKAE